MAPKSKVERLPQALRDRINQMIQEGGHTTQEILDYLGRMPESAQADLPSPSGMARYRQSAERALARMQRVSHAANEIMKKAAKDPKGDTAALVNSSVQNLLLMQANSLGDFVDQQVEKAEDGKVAHNPDVTKEALQLAKASKDVASSQKLTADRVLKIEQAAEERAKREAAEAVEDAAVAEGLSTQTVDAIKRKILGMG
ncbi:phage protein Gp27 family protein [Magnetococcus sp. PR-3]|uniref:phage protein Gp27 family protein n=1 Tax=Magnetococcus sp. PR-3 TaxID=3120355 RepID=UPI002FCDE8E8